MISILSTPHAGSTYLCRLLEATGLVLGHERPNHNGVCGFPFDEVDHLGWTATLDQHPDPILLMREPLACVRSMATQFREMRLWMQARLGLPDVEPELRTWMRVWETVNGDTLKKAALVVRVEDLDDPMTGAYERLCHHLRLEPRPELLPFRKPWMADYPRHPRAISDEQIITQASGIYPAAAAVWAAS
uniref:Putative sulfotransferase domain contining protein n=1 Tax=viral metagenome TaxID=1070528 RepID=A0A6M3KLG3_9ZZZZ